MKCDQQYHHKYPLCELNSVNIVRQNKTLCIWNCSFCLISLFTLWFAVTTVLFSIERLFCSQISQKNQCYYCNKMKINHSSNGNVSFILVWSAVCCVTCAVFLLYNIWNVGHTYYAIQPYYGSFESIYCVEWWIFTPKIWTLKKRIEEYLTKIIYRWALNR